MVVLPGDCSGDRFERWGKTGAELAEPVRRRVQDDNADGQSREALPVFDSSIVSKQHVEACGRGSSEELSILQARPPLRPHRRRLMADEVLREVKRQMFIKQDAHAGWLPRSLLERFQPADG